MGVKDLWSVLTPHAERKPICELRGKTVAIDLAGWVCESLNVVDYFVHPRHHLKNLFFRTCYLIWEDVTPIFVLEGVAPILKSQVIAKRNELQFRGVKPREKNSTQSQADAGESAKPAKEKGRTRFNHVLKQCETLLKAMGMQCVQGPGEAEAYCAFLNKRGLVDGVISQDSDCFAYGAVRVYRNFSVSTQGAQAAQGGAVDIYDMRQICEKMDFGQNKIIVMALLCGCDYCPDGVGGVGRDGVLKLFNKYDEKDILRRIRSWRSEDDKYTALEMRVDDKTICSNCGHLGRTQSHTKSGCGVCRTNRGCDESLWKEERLSLKAELLLRKKALADPNFPNEEIIQEFLSEPSTKPVLNLSWGRPNVVKFIKQTGHLLQWPEIYCFEKFFPVLTRWQLRNAKQSKQAIPPACVEPKEIVKKRILKGVPSLEVVWQDNKGYFEGLIPDEQLKEFEANNPKGIQQLWTTVEPLSALEQAYPEMIEAFIKSKEKPKRTKSKKAVKTKENVNLNSLDNVGDLIAATNDVARSLKPKRVPKAVASKKGLQPIDKFFKQVNSRRSSAHGILTMPHMTQCSTPITKCILSDLDSICDEEAFDLSDIINGITRKPAVAVLNKHAGRRLQYEPISKDLSLRLAEKSLDDLDVMTQKRRLTKALPVPLPKRLSLDDSFDVLVKQGNRQFRDLMEKADKLDTHLSRFMQRNRPSLSRSSSMATAGYSQATEEKNVSYFFDRSVHKDEEDEFEKSMDLSFSRKSLQKHYVDDDCVLISDNSDNDS